MAVSLNLTQDQAFVTLRSFLLSVLPDGVEVIQGQENRVPEPKADDFVIMNPARLDRLATNIETWDQGEPAPVTYAFEASTMATFPCDVHGPNGADNAQIITTMWRSYVACDFYLATGLAMAPLYSSDPKQVPFVNAEQAYEDRWQIDLATQMNPVVTAPQQFADELVIGVISVDASYPPS